VGSFVEKLTFRGWFTTEDGTRLPRYWGHSFIVVPRKLWSGLASQPKAASAPTEIHLLRRRLQEAGVSAAGADVLEIGAATHVRDRTVRLLIDISNHRFRGGHRLFVAYCTCRMDYRDS
jgi:hypothetical protein